MSMPQTVMNSKTRDKLKGKDLVTIGIFSALYFVINFIFMLMGGIHPVMWILMPGLIALFTGVPYMMLAAKVPKLGAVLIMGFITGLIYFVTGMFTVVILITFAAACVVAEAVRLITKYRSFAGNAVSFVIFSVGMIGSPLPVWLFRDSFFAQIAEQGMSADYLAVLSSLASNEMLLVMVLAPVVLGVAGALIAKALFKKHFAKAGIV
ncbi:MptD family putative ECF transporter S component [Desulfitobacterium chlororespirans]|uniref:Energy-coupling factor transport system substrate-specific component n=1 Tax=Desulfitobacterium chlororespirans DSM 11544 TaxID=1121395 RepID=A0A1M7TVQ1_9FIRM|nr:MptD family putative ECF transporter S component [Desulfitobacterium chlororespirans]SHN74807.1 energy-coupling factor transport system substrate-specific component [Desulfitobacterium chlororespirans DSM 11544]